MTVANEPPLRPPGHAVVATAVPDVVYELVERFQRNLTQYRATTYNETQVRREFLDPFFEALGWDVNNRQGYAEAYKDVVHEDAIRIAGKHKAPDYSFRIGGTRKFFVEAKKPAVDLGRDPQPALQVRRYAWSAKLPLSILTDFEELAVYDCRIQPEPSDRASAARTMLVPYTEYPSRWSELYGRFSREAVLRGSFDDYTDSAAKKRGTAEVDAVFLKDLQAWRQELARTIALRNKGITPRELNFAVQQILDRLVFLRICEDRLIEEYGRLRTAAAGKGAYAQLMRLFSIAEDRYNSGLFHFKSEKGRTSQVDAVTPGLTIDDKVLRDIIRHLYYPDSPYEFSVFSGEILGQVYEQFLGQVIRLTASGRAEVEAKPEVRKAGGVFYTPTFIVRYIVERTIGRLLEGKTPKQVALLRFLDPACGSGSFLIAVFQFLMDWHLAYYIADGPEKHARGRPPRVYQAPGGGWRLTTDEKKRILLNNVFGVDIDPQAVEVTKLSLVLKVLEGETAETLGEQLALFQERVLPDLGSNIKCGNTLIGTDLFTTRQPVLLSDDDVVTVNAFDWKSEFPGVFSGPNPGFDAIVGNPPYDVLEKDRRASSWPHFALSQYVRGRQDYEPALGGKLNLFRFFLIRSVHLLRDGGQFGMIIPLAVLADISSASTRRFLFRATRDLLADCFPQKDNAQRRVFRDAKLSTCVITATRSTTDDHPDPSVTVRVYPWNSFTDEYTENTVRLSETELLDPDNTPIPLVDAASWQLCLAIHRSSRVRRLGDMQDFEIRRGEVNQTIYREYITSDTSCSRLVKGVEIGQFEIRETLSQGRREWFDEQRFLHRSSVWPVVEKLRIATQRITGVDERLRLVAALVDPRAFLADSTNSITATANSSYDLAYLLALLNSDLWQWRFKITSSNNNVATNELKALPFRLIDLDDAHEWSLYGDIIAQVRRMTAMQAQVRSARTAYDGTPHLRQFQAAQRALNQMIYELYGLSDEDVRLVEASMRRPTRQTTESDPAEVEQAPTGHVSP